MVRPSSILKLMPEFYGKAENEYLARFFNSCIYLKENHSITLSHHNSYLILESSLFHLKLLINSINRFSVYVLVKFMIRNETSHLSKVRLKSAIKEKLGETPNESISQFRTECGDSFMSGYTTGCEYYGIVEIMTDSSEMKSSLKTEIGASVSMTGIGEASSENSLAASLSKITKNKAVRIWTYQRGGAGEDEIGPVKNVEGLFARANNLATSVKTENNPRKITATFTDYFSLNLNLPNEYRVKLHEAQKVMRNLARMQSELMDLQADIDFIAIHPNSFANFSSKDRTKLEAAGKEIVATMRNIYSIAEDCQIDYEQCKIPESLSLPKVQLPERRETVESISRDLITVTTNLQNIVLPSLQDGWFNPPECYVQIKIGSNSKGSVRLRRSETVFGKPRCQEMNFKWDIPINLIENQLESMGASLAKKTPPSQAILQGLVTFPPHNPIQHPQLPLNDIQDYYYQ